MTVDATVLTDADSLTPADGEIWYIDTGGFIAGGGANDGGRVLATVEGDTYELAKQQQGGTTGEAVSCTFGVYVPPGYSTSLSTNDDASFVWAIARRLL